MTSGYPPTRVFALAVLVLAFALGAGSTLAQEMTTPPRIEAGCPYVLKDGVPFAWLRFEPSSYAGFSVTLRPGETVSPDASGVHWDGAQWWVRVWPNASPARGYYWVEFNSLVAQCPEPTPPPGSGAANWQPGTPVRIKSSLPFVWFRTAPAPGSPPFYTVYPPAQLVIVQAGGQDSYNQWWWLVRDPRNNATGWVEQNALEPAAAPPPSTPPPTWQTGDIVRVRLNVPFSWLRPFPNSLVGPIFTAVPGQQLIVLQGPQHDGVQNWWKVAVMNRDISGWVEENSLEFVSRGL